MVYIDREVFVVLNYDDCLILFKIIIVIDCYYIKFKWSRLLLMFVLVNCGKFNKEDGFVIL